LTGYPIDNLVEIDWQNVKFKVEPANIVGGNFLASLSDLDAILIEILISTTGPAILEDGSLFTVHAADNVEGFHLVLSVGTSLAAIEANPSTPFQLSYGEGTNPRNPIEEDFGPYSGADAIDSFALQLRLNQFENYAALVSQMQNGVPLAFSLGGAFFGSVAAGGALPACVSGGFCPEWPGLITVNVVVPPPSTPSTPVPEPSSLAMLSIGGAIAAGVRRRRR
jgi:hypothetical protein